jgi:hypothetical protein
MPRNQGNEARHGPPCAVRGGLIGIHRVSFLLRGVSLWIGVRLAMAFFGFWLFSPVQVAVLFVVVYAGSAVDQRVRREDVLFGNAGVSPRVGPLHALAAAILLEAAVQAAYRGFT